MLASVLCREKEPIYCGSMPNRIDVIITELHSAARLNKRLQ